MTNFHTHTYRCKHAIGTALEYAEAAKNKNINLLGFSDHTPLPDNRWSEVRMDLSELPQYSQEIDALKVRFKDMRILKGAECEYSSEFMNFYREELFGRYQFDYLIGGAHYFPHKGEWIYCYGADNSKKHLMAYTDYLIDSIDCDLFSFIAHPDLFGLFYHKWDDETTACSKAILEAARDKNRVLEINGLGYRKSQIFDGESFRKPYPRDHFWDLARDYSIEVVINSDAHKPDDIANWGGAIELAKQMGLKVIENI